MTTMTRRGMIGRWPAARWRWRAAVWSGRSARAVEAIPHAAAGARAGSMLGADIGASVWEVFFDDVLAPEVPKGTLVYGTTEDLPVRPVEFACARRRPRGRGARRTRGHRRPDRRDARRRLDRVLGLRRPCRRRRRGGGSRPVPPSTPRCSST